MHTLLTELQVGQNACPQEFSRQLTPINNYICHWKLRYIEFTNDDIVYLAIRLLKLTINSPD